MRAVVAASAVALCLFPAVPVDAKGGGGGGSEGGAFCSARNDIAGDSPYWEAKYRLELAEDEGKCANACSEAKDGLDWCAPHVQGTFCARAGLFNTTGLSAQEINRRTDEDARECTEGVDTFVAGEEVDADKCSHWVLKGACALAFPRCSIAEGGSDPVADAETVAPCRTVCSNERVMCRDMSSELGSIEEIDNNGAAGKCMDEPWVNLDGGPEQLECTGDGLHLQPSSLWAIINFSLAIAVVVGVVYFDRNVPSRSILRWMHPPAVKLADDDPEQIAVVKKFDRVIADGGIKRS